MVDDDAAVRDSLKKLIEQAGYQAVLADDGQQGRDCLGNEHFDLLILDLDLPKISGWDLLDWLALNERHLPVIVLTALVDECEPGALVTADVLLEKPPDVSLLLKTVDKLLQEPTEALWQRRLAATRPVAFPVPLRQGMRGGSRHPFGLSREVRWLRTRASIDLCV